MEISHLLTETNQLLSDIDHLSDSHIPLLQVVLRKNNQLYYMEESPIISDREYDILFRKLKSLEEEYSVWDPTSPTKRVDILVESQFQK